jgi:hypothetical protein
MATSCLLRSVPCTPKHVSANDGCAFRLPLRITDSMHCTVLLCFGKAIHADENDQVPHVPAIFSS